jgi:hypothetical protein
MMYVRRPKRTQSTQGFHRGSHDARTWYRTVDLICSAIWFPWHRHGVAILGFQFIYLLVQ